MGALWSQRTAPPSGGWACWRCRSVWVSGSRKPSRRTCRPPVPTCGDSSSSLSAFPTKGKKKWVATTKGWRDSAGSEGSPETGCQRFYSKKTQTHWAGPEHSVRSREGHFLWGLTLKPTATQAGGWLQRYLGLLEVAEKAELLWPQDQQGMTSALDAPGCPAHPVDVLLQMIKKQKRFKIYMKIQFKNIRLEKKSVTSAFKVFNFNTMLS